MKKKPPTITVTMDTAMLGSDRGNGDGNEVVEVPTMEPSTNFLYDAVIRLTDEEWSSELEVNDSETYKHLEAKIKDQVS